MLSLAVLAVAGGILVSAFVGLGHGGDDAPALFISAAISGLVGFPLYLATRLRDRTMIGYREGFIVVSAGWLTAMVFGALPYLIYGLFGPLDALFEAMSGFTTTGASVLTDFAQPRGIIFWRSLTHWYGGMGIIVLFIAVLPPLGGGAIRLFAAESPGPVPERLTPKIRDTARGLWLIYVGITLAEILALVLVGSPLYDAVTHTFGTVATGGFSPLASSIGEYGSWQIEAVITIFMMIAGVNFALYYAVVTGHWRRFTRDPELRLYLALLGAGTALVTISLLVAGNYTSIVDAFRYASFQVVSIQTTTGYATADFDTWTSFAKTLLLGLMFVGGCAGSTAGGMKVARMLVLGKNARLDLRRQLHPRAVLPVKIGGRAVSDQLRVQILGFFFIYVAAFAVATLIVATTDISLVSAASAVAATLNNIGPGLELVGPIQNFAPLAPVAKIVLIFMMLLGRLELFAVLVPLTRGFWRR
jgi:trk system potassium uptake protein TrkH